MSYCEVEDVIRQLSYDGSLYVFDDNQDSSINSAELDAIEECINWAASKIDKALSQFLNTPRASAGNEFLKFVCRDIAVYKAFERKGQGIPEGIKDAYTEAREELDAIEKGESRPPGVEYPGDGDDSIRRGMGLPMVANPGARGRR